MRYVRNTCILTKCCHEAYHEAYFVLPLALAKLRMSHTCKAFVSTGPPKRKRNSLKLAPFFSPVIIVLAFLIHNKKKIKKKYSVGLVKSD